MNVPPMTRCDKIPEPRRDFKKNRIADLFQDMIECEGNRFWEDVWWWSEQVEIKWRRKK